MAEKNRYQGVNAHLMSYLQNSSGYKGFHNSFVTYLAGHLNKRLGGKYRAATEDTLKIMRTFDDENLLAKNTYPDIAVRQHDLQKSLAVTGTARVPDLYVELPKVAENKEPLSVIIYEKDRSSPIVIIEMVSPANKRGGSGSEAYLEKRYLLTRAGIVLVEVDLLHESLSVIDGLPEYPHDPSSLPYYIAVTDTLRQKKTGLYRFGINQPIPSINIPLLNDEMTTCDFDSVYQQTFEEGFFDALLDYTKEPLNMTLYSKADQQKIREVMAKGN